MTTPTTDTDRLAEIRANAEHQLMLDRSIDTIAARDHAAAVDDRAFLLSLVDSLQERLDTTEGQLAEIRENQLGIARGFHHDAEAQIKKACGDWRDPVVRRAEGTAHGAVTALQVLLVTLGEVEYEEEAEAAWALVERKGEEGSR